MRAASPTITSARNPLLQRLRRLLRSRRARTKEGQFVVEGIQGVIAAVQSAARIEAILYAPDLLTSTLALETVERAAAGGIRVERLPADLFAALSRRERPAGIMALVAASLDRLEQWRAAPNALYVALAGISDPGNLGTIIRSMDGAAGTGVILVGSTVDPFHPAAVKAGAGTGFTMPIAAVDHSDRLLAWCEAQQVTVVATSDGAETDYWSAAYPMPLLLLMGAEGDGLEPALLARASTTVRIPMYGGVDSLNVAVATALLLYEVRRRSAPGPGRSPGPTSAGAPPPS